MTWRLKTVGLGVIGEGEGEHFQRLLRDYCQWK